MLEVGDRKSYYTCIGIYLPFPPPIAAEDAPRLCWGGKVRKPSQGRAGARATGHGPRPSTRFRLSVSLSLFPPFFFQLFSRVRSHTHTYTRFIGRSFFVYFAFFFRELPFASFRKVFAPRQFAFSFASFETPRTCCVIFTRLECLLWMLRNLSTDGY